MFKKSISIILILLSIAIGSFVYHQTQRYFILKNVKQIDKQRISELYSQLIKYKNQTNEFTPYIKFNENEIPEEFQDINPIKISISRDKAYLFFWFNIDESIQFDINGLDLTSSSNIILSYGEPGSSEYKEELVWSSNAF